MSLADRVALVVIIDSIGYAQGISEVMEEVGCSLPVSTIECLKRRNAKREYDKAYHSSIEHRRQRGAKQREKIIESLRHRSSDKKNGIEYEPCIAVRKDVEEENSGNNKSEMTPAAPDTIAAGTKKRQKKDPVVCPLKECGLKGHKTTGSRKCKMNPNYVPPTGKFTITLHTLKNHENSSNIYLQVCR